MQLVRDAPCQQEPDDQTGVRADHPGQRDLARELRGEIDVQIARFEDGRDSVEIVLAERQNDACATGHRFAHGESSGRRVQARAATSGASSARYRVPSLCRTAPPYGPRSAISPGSARSPTCSMSPTASTLM